MAMPPAAVLPAAQAALPFPVVLNPNPIVQGAVRVMNGELNEQNDVNNVLANLVVMQQAQRVDDLARFRQVVDQFQNGILRQRQDIDALSLRIAQNQGDVQEARRQHEQLRPQVEAAERVLPRLQQIANDPAEFRRLADNVNRFMNDQDEQKRQIQQEIAKIRNSLGKQINGLDEKCDGSINFNLYYTVLFGGLSVLWPMGVMATGMFAEIAGVTALSEAATVVFGKTVETFIVLNLIPVPLWLRPLFYKVRKENQKDVLDKFESFLKQGLAPKFALEMARK
jgi:hypothetical protein